MSSPAPNGVARLASSSTRSEIPSYVLEYAPLVHLSKNEYFWPSSHLTHIQNCNPVPVPEQPAIPEDIRNSFNLLAQPSVNDEHCYLTAKKDVRKNLLNAGWLTSTDGKPDASGHCSVSPVVLITVAKEDVGPGVVDAFWFFFYSFNYGPTVIDIHFGNHEPNAIQADWEHVMMRFVNGVPTNVHVSEHADGTSYTYECLEKKGVRPILYSAVGSHAMYPTTGKHDYSPVKLLGPCDYTDAGPVWDPTLNHRAFSYTPTPDRNLFDAYSPKDDEFIPCLQYRGQWGDKFSLAPVGKSWYVKFGLFKVRRAICLYALRWGDGVSGPRDKTLDRKTMNQHSDTVHTSRNEA